MKPPADRKGDHVHFTVVFNSHIFFDLSYGLTFAPNPLWKRGGEVLSNLHPEEPGYLRGDLKPVLYTEDMTTGIALDPREAAIIVHTTGSGTEEDLANLTADLEEADFAVKTLRFGS